MNSRQIAETCNHADLSDHQECTFHQTCLKYTKSQIHQNDSWHLAKHEEVPRTGKAKHVALKKKGTIILHQHNILSVHPVHALTIICTRNGAKRRYPIDPDAPPRRPFIKELLIITYTEIPSDRDEPNTPTPTHSRELSGKSQQVGASYLALR